MDPEAEKAVTAEEVPQEQAEEAPKDGEAPSMHRPKRLTKPDVSRHKAEVDEMHNKAAEGRGRTTSRRSMTRYGRSSQGAAAIPTVLSTIG